MELEGVLQLSDDSVVHAKCATLDQQEDDNTVVVEVPDPNDVCAKCGGSLVTEVDEE